jgi:hypothetical protein
MVLLSLWLKMMENDGKNYSSGRFADAARALLFVQEEITLWIG